MASGRANLWRLAALLAVLLAVAACTGSQFRVSANGWTALSAEKVTGEDGIDTAIALYVGTRNGEVLALDPKKMSAAAVGTSEFTRNGNTGDGLLWSFKPEADPELGGVFGPPAIGPDLVYVGFSDRDGESGVLYALKKDRDARAMINLEQGEWEATFEGKIVGGPALAPDLGLVIVGTDDGRLHGFDADTGPPAAWVYPAGNSLGPIWSTPLVHQGRAYFGSLDHGVHAVSLSNGSKVGGWPFATGGAVMGRPLLVGDRLVVGSFDRTLYGIDLSSGTGRRLATANKWFWAGAASDGSNTFAVSLNGQVFVLDRDGNVMRTFEVEGPVVAQPSVIESGGRAWVVMANEDGALHLVSNNEQMIDAAQVLGSRIKAPLVGVGRELYLSKEDGMVWALTLRGSLMEKLWSLDTTG